jgi:hypothetical protein
MEGTDKLPAMRIAVIGAGYYTFHALDLSAL